MDAAEHGLAIVEADDSHPHAVVIAVRGEIDLSNADSVRDAILAGVQPSRRDGAVVLDLTSTDYLDSAGIRMLFELEQGRSAARRIRVVAPPPSAAHRVLELAGFHAYESIADAIPD